MSTNVEFIKDTAKKRQHIENYYELEIKEPEILKTHVMDDDDLYSEMNVEKKIISMFGDNYNQYSKFSIESYTEQVIPISDFGKTIYFKVPHRGDMIWKIYLSINLPSLIPPPTSTYACWTNAIGYVLLETLDLFIDGKLFDTQSGMSMFIRSQTAIKKDLYNGIKELVGIYDTTCSMRKNAQHIKNLIVPLDFWFCREYNQALPLVAMKFSEVEIRIKLREFNECWVTSDGSTPTIGEGKFELEVLPEYIFLSNEEREMFVSRPHDIIIEQNKYEAHVIKPAFDMSSYTTSAVDIMSIFQGTNSWNNFGNKTRKGLKNKINELKNTGNFKSITDINNKLKNIYNTINNTLEEESFNINKDVVNITESTIDRVDNVNNTKNSDKKKSNDIAKIIEELLLNTQILELSFDSYIIMFENMMVDKKSRSYSITPHSYTDKNYIYKTDLESWEEKGITFSPILEENINIFIKINNLWYKSKIYGINVVILITNILEFIKITRDDIEEEKTYVKRNLIYESFKTIKSNLLIGPEHNSENIHTLLDDVISYIYQEYSISGIGSPNIKSDENGSYYFQYYFNDTTSNYLILLSDRNIEVKKEIFELGINNNNIKIFRNDNGTYYTSIDTLENFDINSVSIVYLYKKILKFLEKKIINIENKISVNEDYISDQFETQGDGFNTLDELKVNRQKINIQESKLSDISLLFETKKELLEETKEYDLPSKIKTTYNSIEEEIIKISNKIKTEHIYSNDEYNSNIISNILSNLEEDRNSINDYVYTYTFEIIKELNNIIKTKIEEESVYNNKVALENIYVDTQTQEKKEIQSIIESVYNNFNNSVIHNEKKRLKNEEKSLLYFINFIYISSILDDYDSYVHNGDDNINYPIIPRNKWDFITQTIESSSGLEDLFAVSGEIQEYTVVNPSSNQVNKPIGADWNTNDIIVYKKGTLIPPDNSVTEIKLININGISRWVDINTLYITDLEESYYNIIPGINTKTNNLYNMEIIGSSENSKKITINVDFNMGQSLLHFHVKPVFESDTTEIILFSFTKLFRDETNDYYLFYISAEKINDKINIKLNKNTDSGTQALGAIVMGSYNINDFIHFLFLREDSANKIKIYINEEANPVDIDIDSIIDNNTFLKRINESKTMEIKTEGSGVFNFVKQDIVLTLDNVNGISIDNATFATTSGIMSIRNLFSIDTTDKTITIDKKFIEQKIKDDENTINLVTHIKGISGKVETDYRFCTINENVITLTPPKIKISIAVENYNDWLDSYTGYDSNISIDTANKTIEIESDIITQTDIDITPNNINTDYIRTIEFSYISKQFTSDSEIPIDIMNNNFDINNINIKYLDQVLKTDTVFESLVISPTDSFLLNDLYFILGSEKIDSSSVSNIIIDNIVFYKNKTNINDIKNSSDDIETEIADKRVKIIEKINVLKTMENVFENYSIHKLNRLLYIESDDNTIAGNIEKIKTDFIDQSFNSYDPTYFIQEIINSIIEVKNIFIQMKKEYITFQDSGGIDNITFIKDFIEYKILNKSLSYITISILNKYQINIQNSSDDIETSIDKEISTIEVEESHIKYIHKYAWLKKIERENYTKTRLKNEIDKFLSYNPAKHILDILLEFYINFDINNIQNIITNLTNSYKTIEVVVSTGSVVEDDKFFDIIGPENDINLFIINTSRIGFTLSKKPKEQITINVTINENTDNSKTFTTDDYDDSSVNTINLPDNTNIYDNEYIIRVTTSDIKNLNKTFTLRYEQLYSNIYKPIITESYENISSLRQAFSGFLSKRQEGISILKELELNINNEKKMNVENINFPIDYNNINTLPAQEMFNNMDRYIESKKDEYLNQSQRDEIIINNIQNKQKENNDYEYTLDIFENYFFSEIDNKITSEKQLERIKKEREDKKESIKNILRSHQQSLTDQETTLSNSMLIFDDELNKNTNYVNKLSTKSDIKNVVGTNISSILKTEYDVKNFLTGNTTIDKNIMEIEYKIIEDINPFRKSWYGKLYYQNTLVLGNTDEPTITKLYKIDSNQFNTKDDGVGNIYQITEIHEQINTLYVENAFLIGYVQYIVHKKDTTTPPEKEVTKIIRNNLLEYNVKNQNNETTISDIDEIIYKDGKWVNTSNEMKEHVVYKIYNDDSVITHSTDFSTIIDGGNIIDKNFGIYPFILNRSEENTNIWLDDDQNEYIIEGNKPGILVKFITQKNDNIYQSHNNYIVNINDDAIDNNVTRLVKFEESVWINSEEKYIWYNNTESLINNESDVKGLNKIVSIPLYFNNPIKNITWVFQDSHYYDKTKFKQTRNNWFNFSSASRLQKDGVFYENMKIIADNQEIQKSLHYKHYKYVNGYKHKNNVTNKNIFHHSFCINPDSSQPSGSFNPSNIEDFNFEFKMQPLIRSTSILLLFVTTLNVITIENGEFFSKFL